MVLLSLNFQVVHLFKRRLNCEVPKQSIYLARYGQSAWNRRCMGTILREIIQMWSAAKFGCPTTHKSMLPVFHRRRQCIAFHKVTVWRGLQIRQVAWIAFCNVVILILTISFKLFIMRQEEYGLPEDVIIDNGKDYRCKDFAGGRTHRIHI